MALIGNGTVLNKSFAFFTNGTSTAGAYAANNMANWTSPSVLRARFINMDLEAAYPVGYEIEDAYLPPAKSGGIAAIYRLEGSATLTATGISARLSSATFNGAGSVTSNLSVLTQGAAALTGAGSVTAAALATSSLSSALSGAASVTAGLSATVEMEVALLGAASVSANVKGKNAMAAHIDVGAVDGLSAAEVWEYDISGISTAGTSGKKLNDASSAGNPWEADLASNNTSGTFGEFVQKLLKKSTFLGLK